MRGNYKHGLRYTKLYAVWKSIKARCLNPNCNGYDRYGGRGITVCAEWLDPARFCAWAMGNGYREHLVIDRIDNDGNYEPSNCRFVDWATSNRNRSCNVVNEAIVREIRALYDSGMMDIRQIADKYALRRREVSRIVKRIYWKL